MGKLIIQYVNDTSLTIHVAIAIEKYSIAVQSLHMQLPKHFLFTHSTGMENLLLSL